MIYYIPIEPLEERYTEQWYRWFPEEFANADKFYTIIDGVPLLADKIVTGTFLDINSTLYYKAEQLKRVAQLFYERKVQNGDVFFVADIEFWGIESIRYLATLNNIEVKLVGFCHAASYTREDFFEKCTPYAKFYEEAWFNTFDIICVGSEYHKQQMITLRNAPPERIVVTGNPYRIQEVKKKVEIREKKNRVILTNRPDYEKRPNLSLDVMEILHQRHPNWEFVVTTGRETWGKGWIREKAESLEKRGVISIHQNLTKVEYLQLVQESKVMISNSIEENFGYCILEAMIFNTVPILSNGYAHPELVDGIKDFLFDSLDEQIEKIENVMKNFPLYNVTRLPIKYELSLRRIVSHL